MLDGGNEEARGTASTMGAAGPRRHTFSLKQSSNYALNSVFHREVNQKTETHANQEARKSTSEGKASPQDGSTGSYRKSTSVYKTLRAWHVSKENNGADRLPDVINFTK